MAPVFHGVMAGDMPLMGLGTEPKNIPVAGSKDVQQVNMCSILAFTSTTRTNPALTSRHADARYVCRDLHAVLALLGIKQQVEAAGSCWGQLAKHDVLRHTLHRVALSVRGRLHQHIHLQEKGKEIRFVRE